MELDQRQKALLGALWEQDQDTVQALRVVWEEQVEKWEVTLKEEADYHKLANAQGACRGLDQFWARLEGLMREAKNG